MAQNIRFDLPQSELPRAWYNMNADMPVPMMPPLHPQTKEPVTAEFLSVLSPMALLGQDMSRDEYIEIPDPIREIYKRAFAAADLPYFNPHSFRDMLVRHAMSLDLTPEQMKAWSQNLGHTDVLTTFTSYGTVPVARQGELIRAAGPAKEGDDWTHGAEVQALLKALAAKAGKGG